MEDPKKDKTKSTRKKGWEGILFWIFLIILIPVSLGGIYWIMTLLYGWAGLGGIGSFVLTAIFCIAFRGPKQGLVLFTLLFVVCTVIATVIWFRESPEFRAGFKAYYDKDYATAIENFNIVIKDGTDSSDVYVKRCKSLRRMGRAADALPDCNQAIKMGHLVKDESYGTRGRVYADLGKYEEAIKDFNVAVLENPNVYDLHERGRVYILLKRYDLALKNFRQVLALDNDYKSAYRGIGNALYKQGKRKEALKAYEQYEKSGKELTKRLKARIEALRQEF